MDVNTNPLDVILLGPTGYTGRLCAEHIVRHLPTDLRWGIAGRSLAKLEDLARELEDLNQDRIQPEILAVQLNLEELGPLVQKTRLLINCVGPYHLYSTPVVEACALHGTHYIDATGETPWIRTIIGKYHETAKANGAIIIPSVGVESVPSDLLTWSLVKRIREEFSCPTNEVISSINDLRSPGFSGGTLSTVLTIIESLSFSDLLHASNPFALAAPSAPRETKALPRKSVLETVLGVRSVRDLGTLTTSPNGIADQAIVFRSRSLMLELYGPNFSFRQYQRVRNVFVGVLVHYALLIGLMLLVLPPVRSLLKRYIYAPGQGPRLKKTNAAAATTNYVVDFCAVATPDLPPDQAAKHVFGRIKFRGDAYTYTGLLLAEAAMVILTNEEKVKKVSRGGIVTSATLGQEYVDRLSEAGCLIESKVFDN
ncbi:hypothetical protein ASPZODRAFT_159010 [Penicilliopsis zonata CBS 506.65]|uniref:Saccharopine dehydrogenase NADP binding domain-containing protein n=1 Tax=Penicilliopsis zonata CBS 506.65 TaxID=1073090 RepID=A0A1L9SIF4_9EURO|nr:hypothetical protein ASPZODRAFT_159010 [Penicilliopsis zonata CBS 506.65]OJJ47010.1 hypothetical protein ASPZODRAFT_159010 [Penicilliopsis zonata CBS 506.65]